MKKTIIFKSSMLALFIMLSVLSFQSKGQSNTPASKDVSISENYEYAYSISKEEMAAMEADRIFERGYAYKKKAALSPNQKDKNAGAVIGIPCLNTNAMSVRTQLYVGLRQAVRASIMQKK